MPVKGSQISTVIRARKGGLSECFSHNDAWNMAHKGMTKADAWAIEKALTDEYGMFWPGRVNADVTRRINARLGSK